MADLPKKEMVKKIIVQEIRRLEDQTDLGGDGFYYKSAIEDALQNRGYKIPSNLLETYLSEMVSEGKLKSGLVSRVKRPVKGYSLV